MLNLQHEQCIHPEWTWWISQAVRSCMRDRLIVEFAEQNSWAALLRKRMFIISSVMHKKKTEMFYVLLAQLSISNGEDSYSAIRCVLDIFYDMRYLFFSFIPQFI